MSSQKGVVKPPQLLFVNKSSRSMQLSRSSTPNEAFLIQSHVQNRRRYGGRKPVREHEVSFASNSSENQAMKEKSSQRNEVIDDSKYTQREWEMLATNSDLIKVQPSKSALDPFDSAASSLDIHSLKCFEYGFSFFENATSLAEVLAPLSAKPASRPSRHSQALQVRRQSCVSNEMLMNATIAYGSSCSLQSMAVRPEDHRDIFVGKTIRCVRKRFEEGDASVTSELISSIASLSFCALLAWAKKAGETENSQDVMEQATAGVTHLLALRRIVIQMGGMMNVPPHIMESLVLVDKYWALLRGSRPLLPFDWDPGHPAESPPTQYMPHLGTAFISVSTEKLGEKLTTIATDVADLLRCSRFWFSLGEISEEHERWLFLRTQAIFYRLLLLETRNLFETTTSRAIILYLLCITRRRGGRAAPRFYVSRIKAMFLSPRIREEGGQDSELRKILFWSVCVAGMALVQADSEGDGDDNLRNLMHAQAVYLGKSLDFGNGCGIESICKMLESYLFLPDEQADLLKRFLLPWG